MVGQQSLTLFIQVRVLVPQPNWVPKASEGFREPHITPRIAGFFLPEGSKDAAREPGGNV